MEERRTGKKKEKNIALSTDGYQFKGYNPVESEKQQKTVL